MLKLSVVLNQESDEEQDVIWFDERLNKQYYV